MATPTVYVICDNNCKYEGMTKEQILAAITQAVNEGTISDIDTGFITSIKTVNGKPLKFFVGTQAEYNALSVYVKKDLFAIVTDEKGTDGIIEAIESLEKKAEEEAEKLSKVLSGETEVPKAKNAKNANEASKSTSDREGYSIATEYFRLKHRSAYAGKVADGVPIYTNGTGDVFLVSLEIGESGYNQYNISFGLVYWDGKKTTYSTDARQEGIDDATYAVRITLVNDSVGGTECSEGLATIVQTSGSTFPMSSSIKEATLRLICVREAMPPVD